MAKSISTMFSHFLKATIRNLIRHKTLSGINLMGMSVGLICVMAIALWIKDELSYDQFHPFKNRLYRVLENLSYSDGTISTQSAAPGLLGETLKEEIPEIVYANTMDTWTNTLLSYNNISVKEPGRYVSTDFLKMFGFPLLQGDPETALSAPNAIVITKRLADKLFPGADPMHKTIKLANWSDHQITGVLQLLPENTVFDFEFLLPMDEFLKRNAWAQSWDNNGLETWVMLKEDVSAETVNAKIKDVVRNQGNQKNVDLMLQPLTDVYLRTDYADGKYQGGGRIQYVRLFGGIAFLILIMACINFMNLSTARATKRAKEVGVRKVIGSSRSQLMLQYFGEAILLSTLATLIALGVVNALLPWFNLLTGKGLTLPFNETSTWMVLGGIILIAGLLAGSYPAMMISSFRPIHVLKGQMDSSPKGSALRKWLVVMQFGIATFLIMATLVMHTQLHYLQTMHLGYKQEHLVFVNMSYEQQEKFDLLKRDLLQTAGVASVSASQSKLTGFINASDNFVWEGKSDSDNRMFVYENVAHDFIGTIGAELIEGRDFSRELRGDSANFVINQSAAEAMALTPPYAGQRLKAWGQDGAIIGVVKDFNFTTLRDPLQPLILLMNNPYVWTMYVRIDGTRTSEVLSDIENTCKKYSPSFPFEYTFADTAYDELYKSEQVVKKISSVFALLAILISCLGLFGLALFTAERRVKEIGIRKVLGASVTGVVALLSKDFLIPVCIALIIALPVSAYFLNQWLQTFAYAIELSWWLFGFVVMMALFIAFGTICYQSIRAAMTNPVKSLRSE